MTDEQGRDSREPSFDPAWETVHREREWGKYPPEEVIRFVARRFYDTDRKATRLLDAGCGDGAVAWYLCREGFATSAFDGSGTAIAKLKTRLRQEGLNADCRVADAADLPYDDGFFDGVIDSAMIYANAVAGIGAILRECHRVLKPGGRLFSTGLYQAGTTARGTGQMIEENTYGGITIGSLAHSGPVHFFERREILDLWTQAGFRNMAIDSAHLTDRGGAIEVAWFMVESEKRARPSSG